MGLRSASSAINSLFCFKYTKEDRFIRQLSRVWVRVQLTELNDTVECWSKLPSHHAIHEVLAVDRRPSNT